MQFSTISPLSSPTGAELAMRVQPAAGSERAVLILSHGLAEHSLRYAAFAEFMAGRGFHVYAIDHRGHGFTKADDAPLGRFAKKDGALKVVADLLALRDHAASVHPGLPIILFGHSMGGIIAANAAAAQPSGFQGLAIWNSNLNAGLAGKLGLLLIKGERFFKGSDVPSFLGPRLTFDEWAKSVENARTPFDWLSRDDHEVAAYIADPLCGFSCSVSLWIDLLGMVDAGGSIPSLSRLPKNMPVNLVGGGRDPATNKGTAMRWLGDRMTSLGITNVHLTIYPDMRHETLNEIGREEAMKAFAAWADGIIAGR